LPSSLKSPTASALWPSEFAGSPAELLIRRAEVARTVVREQRHRIQREAEIRFRDIELAVSVEISDCGTSRLSGRPYGGARSEAGHDAAKADRMDAFAEKSAAIVADTASGRPGYIPHPSMRAPPPPAAVSAIRTAWVNPAGATSVCMGGAVGTLSCVLRMVSMVSRNFPLSHVINAPPRR